MTQNNKQGKEYEKNKNDKIKNKNDKKERILDTVEGFTISSTQDQKKDPSQFFIPNGLDPGQIVMCENDKVRYVRLTQQNNFLTVQEVEVYDKNNVNVALTNNTSAYSNNYQLSDGLCRTDYGTTGYPGSEYYGQIATLQECENACNSKLGCTAYEIQTEETTEGLNPNCYLYKDPSVKGNESQNEKCRIRIRKEGTPTASMSSQYKDTNAYMAINGKKSHKQSWPNSACTANKQGGWWEVDLGKEVDVKKIVIYNRPDGGHGDRLNGTLVTLIDKNHNQVFSSKLNGNRKQIINIDLTKKNCGGPVIEKNMDDFEELKELQLEYFKELQIYNQTMKDLMDNSHHYSTAVSTTNSLRKTFAKDSVTGEVGYVTNRGVWKQVPDQKAKDLMNGRASCPNNVNSAKEIKALDGQAYSIGNAPVGEIINYGNNNQLIKGTPTIYGNKIPGSLITVGQTCDYAGENIYVTKPNSTHDLNYSGCFTQPGKYQSDLGSTNPASLNFSACRQRAADLGSNDFALGGDGRCYVGSNNNSTSNKHCTKEGDIWVGKEIPPKDRCYSGMDSGGNDIQCKFGDANFDQIKKDCHNNPNCGAYNFWNAEGFVGSMKEGMQSKTSTKEKNNSILSSISEFFTPKKTVENFDCPAGWGPPDYSNSRGGGRRGDRRGRGGGSGGGGGTDGGYNNYQGSKGGPNGCIKTYNAYSVGNLDGDAPWSSSPGFNYCVKNYYPPIQTYAGYSTTNADNSALAKTYHITDNIQSKRYPDSMAPITGNDFQEIPGFDSIGNDITSGSLKGGQTVEDIKNLCRNTPGCAGFVMRSGSYWLKNKNMWPSGSRQLKTNNSILYIRKTNVDSNNVSCSKNVEFSTQELFNGIEGTGGLMTESTKCALGKIGQRDKQAINTQYIYLNKILNKIYKKIQELTKEDIKLNEKLIQEYNLLKKRLNKFDKLFFELRNEKQLILKDSAMNEDATLNMLSYNKFFIVWSIIAMGIAYGTIKVMKP